MIGPLEELILLAIQRITSRAYGIEIQQEIKKCTNREISVGAIYSTLNRLKKKNFIRFYLGEKTAIQGGRAKRFYTVMAKGKSALEENESIRQRMRAGITK